MAKENEKANPLLDDEETGNGTPPEEKTEAKQDEKPAPRVTRAAAPAASKKEEVVPTVGRNIQHELLGDAERTRRALAKEPKVWFMAPLSPFEKEGAFEEVYINGYRTTIKKGVMVEIPRPVMEILANKYKIETESGKDFRINRDSRIEDALL